jgi:hypothetical protein
MLVSLDPDLCQFQQLPGHFWHFFGAMAFGAPHAPFRTTHGPFGSAHAPFDAAALTLATPRVAFAQLP